MSNLIRMRLYSPRTFLVAATSLLATTAVLVGCSDSGATDGSAGAPAIKAGAPGAAGAPGTAGAPATTGGSPGSTAGAPSVAGSAPTAGATSGGSPGTSGSPGMSGSPGTGGSGTGTGGAGRGGSSTGGSTSGGSGSTGSGGSGGQFTGTCTASKNTGKTVSGSGPHKVVVETNSANGIKCGTIFRPAELDGAEKYPIFLWGEGGCSQDGLSNQAAMAEIASWGYFIVADGTPGATGACAGNQNGAPFLDYMTWAIAENSKPCSAYYQRLETTKIAADGFSCGGLMAENISGDARLAAVGFTSSGLMGASASLYDKIHTPFKIMNGGSSDIAYENGLRDYTEISSRKKVPIVYFSKNSAGHGGDLGQGKGDFNRVNLAWLNWQLKGDMGATGKGFLTGSTCQFCTDSGWVYKSANLP